MPHESEFIALQEALAGRYSLQRELGRGGMGVVYLAHEVALDRPVALKLLPPHLAVEPSLRERFMREARTAARLSQPNIVPIHAVEQVDGFVFFTMAYVEGESLGEAIRRRGALPAADAARILREVAWALAYAHAQGVVHRDVKPDNILLEAGGGRALVTDFGIAQVSTGPGLTSRGEVLGTAEFMSPEQASGEAVDERSDIYSLGVVGFYMLSGRLPFEGDGVAAILAKHITQPAPPVASVAPEAPGYLARTLDRCLAKQPAERFANGDDLAAALTRALPARREIPVPLRAFIQQNREQLGGLGLWGITVGYASGITVFAVLVDAPVVAVLSGLVAVAIGSAPPVMLWRLARQLSKAGYDYRELLLAWRDDRAARREEMAFGHQSRRTWVDRLGAGLWYGGLGAMGIGTALAVALDLNTLPVAAATAIAALAGGGFVATFVGLPIIAASGGRKKKLGGPGWGRFWESRVGRWLFRLAGVRGGHPMGAATAFRPTEMAIGMAAERLFGELPKATRKQLQDLPTVVQRLEQDAQAMRQRVEELNRAASDLERGAADPELAAKRQQLAADVVTARETAQRRLQDAVTSLETIRLGLLRMHAGTGTAEGITQDLSKADEIAAAVERLLEGQGEVERLLRPPSA